MIAHFAGAGGVTDSSLWALIPGWWTCSQSEAVWESATQLDESVGLCDVRVMTATPEEAAFERNVF